MKKAMGEHTFAFTAADTDTIRRQTQTQYGGRHRYNTAADTDTIVLDCN